MRVLLDTNIILDHLLEREPFADEANRLINGIELKQIQGYMTATTCTDIFYISRKKQGSALVKQALSELLRLLEVCTVDRKIIEIALTSNISDLEDAVQLACALNENLDAIVTRDLQGFVNSPIAILSAGEVLARLS
ncbi:PIN domain-containing protein [Planktothrix mougeotii]|uniref:PIN domain-containing protein n=1 Tax=Planktothrix mougeotii LEGE 06226 TaxID=1828728 RepID=A0ABR9UA18_9CYAN|nr:PIN domain-containing protein [Planktothrix mougeotii]MBE9143277.1 PIN domain-containing protein [Planktothrix mougeotii LEGE 06226]